MSSIFALTEVAKRRVEGRNCRCEAHQSTEAKKDENEVLLLLAVLVLLYGCGASPMLLLAIMYVTL